MSIVLHEPLSQMSLSPMADHPPAGGPHLVTLRPRGRLPATVRAIGVLLGSFDPPQLAHEWIAAQLLKRTEAVLLLVPTLHFSKRIEPPANAVFSQRLEMLEATDVARCPRVTAGLTRVVLFVDLAVRLSRLFPLATVTFAMGSGTFAKLADSRHYAERLGVSWSGERQRRLEELLTTTLVLARGCETVENAVTLPPALRELSSTAVRRKVRELSAEDLDRSERQARLAAMVSPGVAHLLHQSGLYNVRPL